MMGCHFDRIEGTDYAACECCGRQVGPIRTWPVNSLCRCAGEATHRAGGKSEGCCPPEGDGIKAPSLARRAVRFFRAAVRHAAGGMKHVPEQEYVDRLTECDRCVYLKARWCQSCGCRVDVKAAWSSESCPESYWPGESLYGRAGGPDGTPADG